MINYYLSLTPNILLATLPIFGAFWFLDSINRTINKNTCQHKELLIKSYQVVIPLAYSTYVYLIAWNIIGLLITLICVFGVGYFLYLRIHMYLNNIPPS